VTRRHERSGRRQGQSLQTRSNLEEEHFCYTTFTHILTGDREVAIKKKEQLAYALKSLCIRGKSKIEMRMQEVEAQDKGQD
jgi:hypothetical protein